MRRVSVLVLLVFSYLGSFGQIEDALKDRIADAEFYFLNEAYGEALKVFKELYEKDPDNANIAYRIGLCYQMLPFEAGRSIPYLESAVTDMTRDYKEGSYKERQAPIEALYYLGYAYHTNNYLDEAIKAYSSYKDSLEASDVYNINLVGRQIISCQNAKEIAKKPVDVEIWNIGNTVNSAIDDYNPAATADGKTIIFTRATPPKNIDTVGIELKLEDKRIMYTSQDEKGRWAEPVDITDSIGTKGKCETLSLSADGNFLILYKNDWDEGGLTDFKAGTIYYAERVDGQWQHMQKFDNTINSTEFESHACISPDGNTIYFTSERKGGLGGLDIYKTTKGENGKWSPAENLGETINTPYDEDTPFILSDGKTLYFSSEGHFNMGGFDNFKSVLSEDGKWSDPQNLGYPINTPDNNMFFVPVKNGAGAFYSIARHEGYLTFGAHDIYQMLIRNENAADSIEVKGVVSLEDEKMLDSSVTITVIENISKDTVAKLDPNLENGEYSVALDSGEYIFIFEGDDYYEQVKYLTITTSDMIKDNVLTVNGALIPRMVSDDKYFVIKNIYFDFNSAELNKEAMIAAEKLYAIMDENPGLYVELVGHTDSKGTQTYNKKLSAERARAVVDYLTKKGIEPTRFVSKGAGEGQLIALDARVDGSEVPEGAKLNRRVEIRVIKTDNEHIVTLEEYIPEYLRLKEYNKFSVCIAKSKTAIDKKTFSEIKDIAPVIESTKINGEIIYYTGDFDTKGNASVLLNKIISKGFSDACIVDYFQLNKAQDFVKTNEVNTSIKYTIQLKAVERMLILDAFTKLDGVKMYKTKDGYYRYTYKEFDDLSEANKELEKVVESGFVNAFIIDISKLKQ